MSNGEMYWRGQIPHGYHVRTLDGANGSLSYQPMRDWGGNANQRYEALYVDERLVPITYKTLPGAVKCARKFAANAVASRELVYSRGRAYRYWQCERCGEAVLSSDDLHELTADGCDWLACQSCCDAWDRHLERIVRHANERA